MKKCFVPLACLLLLAACKKNTAEGPEPVAADSKEQVKQVLQANLAFIRSFSNGVANMDKARPNGGRNLSPNTQACPGFVLAGDSTGGWGISLALDYGTGCPNDIANGIIRRGKITYKYFLSNNLTTAIGITYNNYLDGPTLYNGILKSTYQYAANGNNWFLGADSLRLNNPAWGSSVYQTAIDYRQQEGAATPFNAADDAYHITGTSTLVNNVLGLSRFEVLTPLLHRANCAWIVSGRVKITLGTAVGIVDFGNGTCDNTGTLEYGGLIFPITF